MGTDQACRGMEDSKQLKIALLCDDLSRRTDSLEEVLYKEFLGLSTEESDLGIDDVRWTKMLPTLGGGFQVNKNK